MVTLGIKTDENYQLNTCCFVHKRLCSRNGNVCGFLFGVAINSSTDAWKSNRLAMVFLCKEEGIFITVGKFFGLPFLPVIPNGSHGMNDKLRGQFSCCGYHGFACFTAALPRYDCPAGIQYLASSCPMDSAVHAAAAHQGCIGGIDNSVCLYLRDVSLYYCNVHTMWIEKLQSKPLETRLG